MPTLRDFLDARHAADRVIVPPAIDELLTSLNVTSPTAAPAAGEIIGKAKPQRDLRLFGFASFNLDPGLPEIDFVLSTAGPAGAPNQFRIDLTLGDRVKLPAAFQKAAPSVVGDRQTLVAAGPGPVIVTGLIALRIEGANAQTASMRFVVPGTDDAVVAVELSPSTALFGESGFGIDFSGGLVVDNSSTEAPPAVVGAPPGPEAMPVWQGIAVRSAKLYFPASTPLLGARPLEIAFALGSPVGIDARCRVEVPANGGKPAVTANFEWIDPAADSLAMCLPTMISALVELPVNGQSVNLTGGSVPGSIALEGVEKLIVRGRFARDPKTSPPTMSFSLGVDRTGPDGLIAVRAEAGFGPAKVFVTAGALAIAFMADADQRPAPSGDASGTTLHALLVAASGLSAALADQGKLVVHGVEIMGTAGPAQKVLRFRVDYSVDVVVKTISVGTLSIGMDPAVPMRVRYRDVALEVDFEKSGLDRFHLSYAQADFGVEDPGKWLINSPGSLLDVLGTRSGHGSTWFEIDLRFALDLGPIKVSGATVRATFNGGGTPAVSLRGLDARIDMPGFVSGEGHAQLQQAGFDAALAATLIPLQIGAMAIVGFEDADDFKKILLGFAVDLPGPIPLLNSGLGIFGFQGIFGINCLPKDISNAPDPATALLDWKPWKPGQMPARRAAFTVGLGASIGTVPDLGFSFSSKALVVVTVPDLAIRASLEGRILSTRVMLAELNGTSPIGPRLLGALAVDGGGLTVGLRGEFAIDPLFKVLIPFGARFPTVGDDWYVHLGSDGFGSPPRGPGPISVSILPDLLNVGASAYLMVRGAGITDFAHLGTDLHGFSIGFGFDWRQSLGFAIVRLDLHAGLAVGLASNPMLFLGTGKLDGSLHLGPVSLGVSADVDLQVGPGDVRWADIHVCGEVDLFFFSISGCADLTVGNKSLDVPDPHLYPLKRLCLTDRFYGDAVDCGSTVDSAPTVWPDAIPILEFAHGPACELKDGSFAGKLTTMVGGNRVWKGTNAGNGATGSGELTYTYLLTHLEIVEVTGGGESPVGGDLWASWQIPKHASADRPGARELALLTWQPHLWTKVLPDAGKSLSTDPTGEVANYCHTDYVAVPWWALGSLAHRERDGWDLPPEPAADARFASTFHGSLSATFAGHPLTPTGLYSLPYPIAFDLGAVESFANSIRVVDHAFRGALRLPKALHRMENWGLDPLGEQLREGIVARISLSTAVATPWLVGLFSRWEEGFPVLAVGVREDGSMSTFAPSVVPGPHGWKAVLFRPTATGSFVGINLRYDARLLVKVLGVRGETLEARLVADAASQAVGALSVDYVQAAAGPVGSGDSLLKPGALYRIDVGQRVEGSRPGSPPAPFTAPLQSYWFKTAPIPTPPAAPPHGPQPLPSMADIFRVRRFDDPPTKPRDTFDPTYLQRYLAGFTPNDRTQNWFWGDPVSVHFKVDYIAQFAQLYGRDLELHCQRTDLAPAQPVTIYKFNAAGLVKSTTPYLAAAADRRLATRNVPPPGDCTLPGSAGASLPGKPPLEPRGVYDLAVRFPVPASPDVGNHLPSIVFTTSRWRGPGELMTGLGFLPPGLGPALTPAWGDGDVAIPNGGVPAGVIIGDHALETVLSGLGMSRWPAPPEGEFRHILLPGGGRDQVPAGRTSLLWTLTRGGWGLTGVFLEAVEPIHRPALHDGETARLVVVSLSHAGAAFPAQVRDASGSRILFLAASSFTPTAGLELIVDEQAPPTTNPSPVVRRSYWLSVKSVPRFAEDSP